MRLSFLSSKTREIQRLLNIRSEYQWFLDNDFPIVLPEFYKQLYQEIKSKKDFKIRLEKELSKIYNKKIYDEKAGVAKSEWEKIETRFFDVLKKHNLKIKDKYLCYISLYGPEGQFKYPNVIDLRISNKSDVKQINETIAHELIHLMILRKVEKLKLNYKQTEGIVDLFFKETELKDIFSDYKLQSIAEHNNKIFDKVIN
ncbi:hypothetical protein CO083_05095 [Candidatus Roizmanbacteria bacterium CG_4_9_14_0_8_um_filter_34_12]|uniref:Uncharacterized protein n=1 Tax=Candidatus Roizmanbacteria bacterium CG_4_9_14_0_8_um_filter_34_12 TaxID=1974840 RepID=A0A2M8DBL7_9BACT|nr:MAG: hypothetical protein CO083_05095 [Candidatus Roizmanbacteria bacterium CG_4_9_14_0_8_um_filter_34_12]